MVAIRNHEADRFLKREAAGFSAYLVFGSDAGLVSERMRTVLAALVEDPSDPFQLVRLRGEDVAGDPGRLADEVGSVPMFGGRRVVAIDATGRDITPAISHHLEGTGDVPVAIEGGNLRKDAALRKLIERSRNAVAIECHPDDERAVAALIEGEIAAAGLSIDPEAQAMLTGLLGADRMASRGEIAKLALYAHGGGSITVDDVEAVVADAAAQATDALIDAAFDGDYRGVESAGRRVLTGPAEAGTLLGAALRHATALHRGSLDLAGGTPPGVVMAQLGRGMAPRRKDRAERLLKSVAPDTLGAIVVRLGEAVGRARREPLLAQALALRTLWSIARDVRRRGAASAL